MIKSPAHATRSQGVKRSWSFILIMTVKKISGQSVRSSAICEYWPLTFPATAKQRVSIMMTSLASIFHSIMEAFCCSLYFLFTRFTLVLPSCTALFMRYVSFFSPACWPTYNLPDAPAVNQLIRSANHRALNQSDSGQGLLLIKHQNGDKNSSWLWPWCDALSILGYRMNKTRPLSFRSGERGPGVASDFCSEVRSFLCEHYFKHYVSATWLADQMNEQGLTGSRLVQRCLFCSH